MRDGPRPQRKEFVVLWSLVSWLQQFYASRCYRQGSQVTMNTLTLILRFSSSAWFSTHWSTLV